MKCRKIVLFTKTLINITKYGLTPKIRESEGSEVFHRKNFS